MASRICLFVTRMGVMVARPAAVRGARNSQNQPPQSDRRGDGNGAARICVGARRDALRFVDLFQDLPTGGKVVAACVGQLQLARRTRQQSGFKQRLEVRQLAADSGQGNLQLAPRSRKTAGVDDGSKNQHGFQAVHDSIFSEERFQG